MEHDIRLHLVSRFGPTDSIKFYMFHFCTQFVLVQVFRFQILFLICRIPSASTWNRAIWCIVELVEAKIHLLLLRSCLLLPAALQFGPG